VRACPLTPADAATILSFPTKRAMWRTGSLCRVRAVSSPDPLSRRRGPATRCSRPPADDDTPLWSRRLQHRRSASILPTIPRLVPLASAPRAWPGPHGRSAAERSAHRAQPRGFPAYCPAGLALASRPTALHRTARCPKLPHGRQPHGDHLPQPPRWRTIQPVGRRATPTRTCARVLDRRLWAARQRMLGRLEPNNHEQSFQRPACSSRDLADRSHRDPGCDGHLAFQEACA
jgi:hypothetical protein